MLAWLFAPEAIIAVVTLTALELLLGIDNVIFIAILTRGTYAVIIPRQSLVETQPDACARRLKRPPDACSPRA